LNNPIENLGNEAKVGEKFIVYVLNINVTQFISPLRRLIYLIIILKNQNKDKNIFFLLHLAESGCRAQVNGYSCISFMVNYPQKAKVKNLNFFFIIY
jgi:hypothetical protein